MTKGRKAGSARQPSALQPPAEAQLRFQAGVLNQMGDAVIAIDNDRRVTYLNPAAEKRYEISAADAVGRQLEEVCTYHWVKPSDEAEAYEALAARGQWGGENIHVTRSGREIWVESTVRTLRDERGASIGLLAVIRDITERKQAEAALRESEERYRVVADFTYDWEFWLGSDGRYRYVSPSVGRILGRTVDLSMSAEAVLRSAVHPEDLEARLEHLRLELADHPPCESEYRIVRPDGEVRWIHHICQAVHDERGRFLGTRGSNRDVTERKQVEQALRESNERFRLFMDNSPTIAWVKDEKGRHVYLSGTCEKRFGVRLADWRGKTDAEVWPREIARRFREVDQAVLAADRPLEVVEETVDPDGTRRYWLNSKFPFRDASGNRFVGGIGLDITERKKAEAALQALNATLEQQVLDRTRALSESEANFRGYFENVAVGAAQIDAQGHFTRVNDRYCVITGYSREELLGGMGPLDLDHPEDRAADRAAIARVFQGQGYSMEKRYVTKDGRVVWVHITVSPILDAAGQFRCTAAVIEEITSRKLIEAALVESEHHLRAIVDTAADGIITLDEEGRIQSMNPAALKLFGYNPAEILGQDLTLLLPVIGKGGSADFLAHHQPAASNHAPGRPFEVSGRTKSGNLIVLELILTPFVHRERNGFVAMLHDVTHRKRLERELVEVSERERQQVGRELHDELGQILHGVHFLGSDLEVRLKKQGVAEAAELGRITHFLDEALAATRNLARGLQPVAPVPEGLMKALQEHAARVRKVYGLSCRFSCPQPVLISDPTVATHLFRIAQEAINNAVRHSKCKSILIRLKAVPQRLILGIEDDGHGRIPAPHRRQGMGLHVMQFRASAINGSLVVQRRARGGTEVVCTVEPFSNQTLDSANQNAESQTP